MMIMIIIMTPLETHRTQKQSQSECESNKQENMLHLHYIYISFMYAKQRVAVPNVAVVFIGTLAYFSTNDMLFCGGIKQNLLNIEQGCYLCYR